MSLNNALKKKFQQSDHIRVAQTPGARSPRLLQFVGPQKGTCFISLFSPPKIWRRLVDFWKMCSTLDYKSRLRLTCDGTRAETRFLLSPKRTNPLKSAGASVKSTTVSRSVPISGRNAGYTMFRGSVKSTGYTLHSPVSPSLPHPSVTVCHQISAGL